MSGFIQTRQELIHRALRIVGVLGLNETSPSSAIYDSCSTCLNTLNEDLRSEGVFLWQKVTFDVSAVASTASYTIADTYETVDKAWIVGADGIDDQLKPITEDDYFEIRQKAYEGEPKSFAMGHELASQTIKFYPTPDASYTIRCLGIKLLPELVNNSDEPEYPSKWLNVLTFGTAYLYAMEAQIPESKVVLLERQYRDFLQRAKQRAHEPIPTFIENAYENTYRSSNSINDYDYGG